MTRFEKIALGVWLGLAALAVATGAGWVAHRELDRVSLCLFRFATGLPCPGCGMGHALVAAFRGEWTESFRFHPLGIPFLAVWTAWLGRVLTARAAGSEVRPLLSAAQSSFVEGAALAVVIGAYALRFAG